MSQPISHKLAPFLATYEPACEVPIAGYATYSELKSPLTPLCQRGDLSPPFLKGGGGDFGSLYLENNADFLKTVYAQKYDQLLDLICADCDSYFRLVYIFQSSQMERQFQLSLDLKVDFNIPTLSGHYASANWLERECFDLFGIRFEGHPHLKRLLMYPEFAGHPLKKHYPIDKAQPLIPIYA